VTLELMEGRSGPEAGVKHLRGINQTQVHGERESLYFLHMHLRRRQTGAKRTNEDDLRQPVGGRRAVLHSESTGGLTKDCGTKKWLSEVI
jgi:hypothetical protein